MTTYCIRAMGCGIDATQYTSDVRAAACIGQGYRDAMDHPCITYYTKGRGTMLISISDVEDGALDLSRQCIYTPGYQEAIDDRIIIHCGTAHIKGRTTQSTEGRA